MGGNHPIETKMRSPSSDVLEEKSRSCQNGTPQSGWLERPTMGEFTKCIDDRRYPTKDSCKVQSDGGVHFNVQPGFSFFSHRVSSLPFSFDTPPSEVP